MKKGILFTALLAFGISVTNFSFAQQQLVAEDHEATNCTYTGNESDYCNASSGTVNVRVLGCRPGSTDCGYSL